MITLLFTLRGLQLSRRAIEEEVRPRLFVASIRADFFSEANDGTDGACLCTVAVRNTGRDAAVNVGVGTKAVENMADMNGRWDEPMPVTTIAAIPPGEVGEAFASVIFPVEGPGGSFGAQYLAVAISYQDMAGKRTRTFRQLWSISGKMFHGQSQETAAELLKAGKPPIFMPVFTMQMT